MIQVLLFVVSAALLLVGGYVSLMNWMVIVNWLRTRKHSSWIPLFGGVLAMLGVALIPIAGARSYWWLPLVIDWGCFPGLLYSAIAICFQRTTEK